MAGKFGSDFNPGQPSDDDLVKRGAGWIRDIKQRIKDTFGILFNIETGDLKDNVISTPKLKDLVPDPEGTWNEVDVNVKGQVTAGRTKDLTVSANINRFTYQFGGGIAPDGTVDGTRSVGLDTDAHTVAQFSFTVPDGVHRLLVRMQGAGGAGDTGASGGGAGYMEAIVLCDPGDSFLVWVGQGGAPAPATEGSITQFNFSDSKLLLVIGGGAATGASPGSGSTPASTGVDGFLQWGGGAGNVGATVEGGASADGSPRGNFGWGGGTASGVGTNGISGYVIVEYWL